MNSYKTYEKVKEYLTAQGFHEYKPSELDKCRYCFQKRYDDEKGKKYFIDARVYDWSWTDRIPEKFHIEYFCQLYQYGTHDAVNLTFIDWTLDQVEKFVNNMFVDNLIEYYEEY